MGNGTRMKMLVPLFKRASAKKDYRAVINPKLVYQYLPVLLGARLVEEADEGIYQLRKTGKTILAEFITFLEKARRTLDLASKEVNLNE